MDKHEPTNVLTAFEMLLEEVENEVEGYISMWGQACNFPEEVSTHFVS